jgi:hypothetical protein
MQTRDVHVYVFDTMADWEVGHAIGSINTPDYQMNRTGIVGGPIKRVGVGMPIAEHPLHRSGRAACPHPALTLGE